MNRLLQTTCLLLTGIVLGWWLRGSTLPYNQAPEPVTWSASIDKPRSSADRADLETSDQPESDTLAASEEQASPARIRLLLTQQKYEQSLAYYEQALKLDESNQLLLKPVIETYLRKCLESCKNEDFLDLVNLWLGTYYQDTTVLLILAESQRLYSTPEEAASTLQLASTYALQTGQQSDVNASVQALVRSTDEKLSSQQKWIELLGFYEFLEIIDLGTPAYRLRQSSLHQILGERQRSREMLIKLREEDDGMNSEWTTMLDSRLAKLEPQPSKYEPQQNAIPITRRGEHFVVASTINGRDQLNLMIDTGASLTTLSRMSFNQLEGPNFQFQGSRIFNTANGLTQGDVYRATSIRLGKIITEMVDIAVLDYQPSSGIDGLLGMNVLRYYRFEIDQDDEILYLRPRQ